MKDQKFNLIYGEICLCRTSGRLTNQNNSVVFQSINIGRSRSCFSMICECLIKASRLRPLLLSFREVFCSFKHLCETWGNNWAGLKLRKIVQFDWSGRWLGKLGGPFCVGPDFLNKSSNTCRTVKLLIFLKSRHQGLSGHTKVVAILHVF
jgi:hypothetical protein